jgi:hypothetical protein
MISKSHIRQQASVTCTMDDEPAVRFWGKPVSGRGFVGVTDRGWGAFDKAGQLISVHPIEDHARRAILARGMDNR